MIRDTGNHYLIKVKANQPTLLRLIEQTVAGSEALDCVETHQKSRGRRECRRVAVYAAPAAVDPAWVGLARVVFVERSGSRGAEAYQSRSYYITSIAVPAERFAAGIRGHWLIENRLHWQKDVSMDEDSSGIGSKQAAATLSLMKNMALTLYRRQGHDSLKTATACFANKVKELLQLTRT